MKMSYQKISSIFFSLVLSVNVFCQKPNSVINISESTKNLKLSPLVLLDGFPLYTIEEMKEIDPQTITSINIKKDTLFDCSGTAFYYGLIIITTKDTINSALKYILQKTGNWILTYPLAEYIVNGVSINKHGGLNSRLFSIQPIQIKNIKFKEPIIRKAKCNNGFIIIKIK